VETTADDFFVQLASRNRFREDGHAGEATAPLFFEGVGSGG